MTEKNRCEQFFMGGRRKHNEDDLWKGESHHPEWADDMQAMVSAVGDLLADVTTTAQFGLLVQRVKTLEDAQARHECLTSLAPSELQVTKPIPISVVGNGDDFVATFFDAKISATGDTPAEAVWNIKDILVLKFNRLNELPHASLGAFLKKQFAVLRAFIEA